MREQLRLVSLIICIINNSDAAEFIAGKERWEKVFFFPGKQKSRVERNMFAL